MQVNSELVELVLQHFEKEGACGVKDAEVDGHNTLVYDKWTKCTNMKGEDISGWDVMSINVYDFINRCKSHFKTHHSAIMYSGVAEFCQPCKLHFRTRSACGLGNGQEKHFDYGLEYISVIKACEFIMEKDSKMVESFKCQYLMS